ncbi:EamA family transporter [Aeromicrobium sp. CnD17-E]|uniref:EamA family transporter n=1 Tax=Aeromicrobium sp. CnD17-E TaxID=2954487 RepID=UPI002096A97D|nr:EamA family transporter [Aeromicrobium sp. CnD17-E]MCO7240948.1 EamA family transporter [Aeromicrobium sp. CnD17-E]
MAVLLSLLSALSYGVSDFLGGLFSKRSGPWQTAVVGQTSSTVCTVAVALFIAGDPVGADWVWGVVGGAGSGVGAAFLYRGLAGGRMSVVAPLSAVVCALLPVAVGLVTGDRPSALALAGIVVAFPAIALVSRVVEEDAAAQAAHRGGVVDGILAGLGFGVLFVALGQVRDDAGLWPLAVAQGAAALVVVLLAVALREAWVPRDRLAWRAVVMGPLGATATTAFLLATREGLLSVVSVISSLYPATTVLLATLVLKERIQAWQGVGLALAASAVTLVALG